MMFTLVKNRYTAFIAHWRGALLLALCLPVLAGCFGVAAVGVGTGALMVSDRRNSEIYVADEALELRASNRINDKFGDKVHVNVTSYNRMLLLTGEAPTEAIKAEIGQIAASVENVKAVSNEIAVAAPSSLGSRSNDTYLTSKVKARFVDAHKFAAQHVKVVTEAGVVYLLGLVTQAEADAAADIARTTSGVQKVVRVFEIITPEQALALDGPQPTKNPASAAPTK